MLQVKPKIFNNEERKFIEENATGRYAKDLTKLFNKKFNRNVTVTQIINYKKDHNIKSNVKIIFTDEEKDFIRNNAKGNLVSEIVAMLNNKFNKSFTYNQVRKFMLTNGIKSGAHNKHNPNRKPIGAERLNTDGTVTVKVENNVRWVKKQRYLYQKYKGDIPEGYSIIFADGNKLNFDLDNLIAISNNEKLLMARKGLFSKDGEVTKLGVLLANLMQKNYNIKKYNGW